MTTLALPAMEYSRAHHNPSPDEMEGVWLVAQVLHRHEFKVRSVLQQMGIQYCLPTCQRKLRREGRTPEAITVPVLAGYVSVCCASDSDAYAVRRHDSVYGIIPVNNQVQFAREIAAVQLMSDLEEVQSYPTLPVGTKCRINKGPFNHFEGIIIERNNKTLVFVVQVTLLGQSIGMDIDADFLEAID